MKRKSFFVITAMIMVVVLAFGLFLKSGVAYATSCEGVNTSIIECGDKESGIGHILGLVMGILTAGIVALGVVGIVIAGTQYLTAKDNEEQVKKSKRRIFEIMIGLAVYAVLAALLQWLLPGGISNPGDLPHYENQDNSSESDAD